MSLMASLPDQGLSSTVVTRGDWSLPYLSVYKVPGTQRSLKKICEGKQGRVWKASLPREIGLAGQVAKVRAITVLHALVPVTISTVGPMTV